MWKVASTNHYGAGLGDGFDVVLRVAGFERVAFDEVPEERGDMVVADVGPDGGRERGSRRKRGWTSGERARHGERERRRGVMGEKVKRGSPSARPCSIYTCARLRWAVRELRRRRVVGA